MSALHPVLCLVAFLALPCLGACQKAAGTAPAGSTTGIAPATAPLTIESPSFSQGAPIPVQYTCDGANRSPELRIGDTPTGTKSLLLIVDDPDAPNGTFVHWTLFDLPASTVTLPEGVKGAGREGPTGFGPAGWGGPCPPPGKAHRYYFRAYALDVPNLGQPESASRNALDSAASGHILAAGELMGTYQRK